MAVAVAQVDSLLSRLTRAKGILFIGPSGSGKTTLTGMIKDRFDDTTGLISTTTRPPRDSDLPDEYEYLGEAGEHPHDVFETLHYLNDFVWDMQFGGHYYGTRKSVFLKALNEGKIFVTHVRANTLVSDFLNQGRYLEDGVILPINIVPPEREIVRQRIMNFGAPSAEEVEIRLNRDEVVVQEISLVRQELMKRGVNLPEINNSRSIEDVYQEFLRIL